MTDQSSLDANAFGQPLQAQPANTPAVPNPQEISPADAQSAMDSIFNKRNNGAPLGDGAQLGSVPAYGSENSAAPALTANIPQVAPAATQTGAIPSPVTGSSGSLQQVNISDSAGIKTSGSGSFSRVVPSQSGTIPRVSNQQGAQEQGEQRATNNNARPIIVFDRVSKVYSAQPNKPALNNITMTISSGEFVFLVGHSGSGKSTYIRLINHEFVVSSGRLLVAGEDLSTIKRWRIPYLRRNIGCVFQDFKLLPNKTAFQNVAFALEVIGKSKHIIRTQVPEVLRLVGLEDKTDKLPDQLSGGEQQRVSIARAIVNRPPMLICDEPTGNLDPQTSLGIMRLLDRINRTGTTIVVATHDREMVDSMRKRVVALENGFLVRDEDKGVYGLDA